MEHRGTETQSSISQEEYLKLNQLTKQVIGAAMEVHRELRPGLLEAVYEGLSTQVLILSDKYTLCLCVPLKK